MSSEQMTPTPAADTRLRRAITAIFVFVVTIALPTAMVVLSVHEDQAIAPREVAHFDYLDRARDGSLPRMGDRVSDQVLQIARCRTFELEQHRPCRDGTISTRPAQAADGYSYQARHPPLYYWVSAGLQEVTGVGPADNFITTGRLTGAIWLCAGTVVLYVALRRLGATVVAAGAGCVLLLASPGLLTATSKVTNEATSLLAGASLLLAYSFLRRRPGPAALSALVTVSAVVVLLQPINLIAVVAVAGVSLVDLGRRIGWWRALVWSAAPVGVAAGVIVGWLVAVDAMATTDMDVVMEALLSFREKSEDPPVSEFFFSAATLPMAFDADQALVGTSAGALAVLGRFSLLGVSVTEWIRARRDLAGIVGMCAFVTLVAAGSALHIEYWISHQLLTGPPPSHGLPMLPLIVVPVALAASRSRRATVGLCLLTVVLLISAALGIVLTPR